MGCYCCMYVRGVGFLIILICVESLTEYGNIKLSSLGGRIINIRVQREIILISLQRSPSEIISAATNWWNKMKPHLTEKLLETPWRILNCALISVWDCRPTGPHRCQNVSSIKINEDPNVCAAPLHMIVMAHNHTLIISVISCINQSLIHTLKLL